MVRKFRIVNKLEVGGRGGGGGGGADRKLAQRPRSYSAASAQGNDDDITRPSEEGLICLPSMEAAELHRGSWLLCLANRSVGL